MSRDGPAGSFDAAERRQLASALARGEALTCPRCGAPMSPTEVRPDATVPYVRKRILVICPACRGSASLDRPAAG